MMANQFLISDKKLKKNRTPPAFGFSFLASLQVMEGNQAEVWSELWWHTVCIYPIHVFKSV